MVQSSSWSELIAVVLSVSAGAGIAWLIWLATGNLAIAIGMAGALGAISNNFLRKVFR